ncbi:MAG: hypothetical protein OEZ34_05975 [Spirochaetia bacterium]|nr:hypothetical protein [Spirochaetia bacterium]
MILPRKTRNLLHSIPNFIKILKIPVILIFVFGILFSCRKKDDPLLSLLTNNRMTVILKGTFATDDPLQFNQINNDNIFVDPDEPIFINTIGLPPYSLLPFYIDIGEIRMSSKFDPLLTVDSSKRSEEFWDTLSPYRQVYCSQPYALDPQLDTCRKTGGFINYYEFMNGRGSLYPSLDVGPGTYLHVGVFLRSLVTGFGYVNNLPNTPKFDNNDVYGTNLMISSNYNPESTDAERQLLPPQFFPLSHSIALGQQVVMHQDESLRPIILEIRFNMKENPMVHAYDEAGLNHSFVGFSDWRKNHLGQKYTGGNVLARARMIYPDISTHVRITGGTESVRHYYTLYISNECADPNGFALCDKNLDYLPLAATPVRNGVNTLKDIMPGSYILQCRYDAIYDGYPEAVLSERIITVPQGPGEINFACACGASTTTGCP